MRSLSELADIYEEWAKANDTTAEMILAGLTSSATEIEEHQRQRAGWLMGEATALREKATALRRMEATMFSKLHNLTKTLSKSVRRKSSIR